MVALFLSVVCFGPQRGNALQDGGHSDEFTIVAYNTENLFDIDGDSLFDDYGDGKYKPLHLLTKVRNIARVLASVEEGAGPEIVLFQELEADRTPGDVPFDHAAFLETYADQTLEQMLSEPVSEAIRDLPASAFLAKAIEEAGLGPYHVIVAEFRPDPIRTVAHVNATFSRFPVKETRTHQSEGARGTLEVVHDINGSLLHTFNNHWKSGASNAESELLRLGNAQVVRDRLDEILAANPAADVVLGGDFNSQYNQSQCFTQMPRTAVNDVLGSQGNELALRESDGPALYNLWYELPTAKRRSDSWQDEWGTLMQMMLTRGLYDYKGVQYCDNSFRVAAFDDLNLVAETGLPVRFSFWDDGAAGFSDHFPVFARFRVATPQTNMAYIPLQNPGMPTDSDKNLLPVDYSGAMTNAIPTAASLGSDEAIRNPELLGQVFRVKATVSADRPFRIRVFDDDLILWSFDRDLRMVVYDRYQVGDSMDFIGELGIHEGRWQFVIRDIAWLNPPPR